MIDDRRLLERTHEELANDVAVIASEFLGGFQKVLEIDRPAVSIFGSARVDEETEAYVRQLEERHDALGDELDVPSGESLAAELTRFLREHEERREEERGEDST